MELASYGKISEARGAMLKVIVITSFEQVAFEYFHPFNGSVTREGLGRVYETFSFEAKGSSHVNKWELNGIPLKGISYPTSFHHYISDIL